MAELSYAQVSALLKYDSETGKLFWKERPAELFSGGKIGDEAAAKRWNKVYAGKEAFKYVSNTGYLRGSIFGKGYIAQRVIWMLHTGEWPSKMIDHIDGNKLNNRIDNLRVVDHSGNGCNTKMRSNNTSGVNGVYWHRRRRKWAAQLSIRGNAKYLGLFESMEEAEAARQAANAQYGFTDRHGAKSTP